MNARNLTLGGQPARQVLRLVRALFDDSQNEVGEREESRESFVCCWAEHRRCNEDATHFHAAFGELCPRHAAEVMRLYPREKVKRILEGVYRSPERKRPNDHKLSDGSMPPLVNPTEKP